MRAGITLAGAAEAVELAYGLLWLHPGRDAKTDRAREALYSIIDREGRLRGVKAAQDALASSSVTSNNSGTEK